MAHLPIPARRKNICTRGHDGVKALAHAMVLQAMEDMCDDRLARSTRRQCARWLCDRDNDNPFSVRWCLEAMGIDPDAAQDQFVRQWGRFRR